jgi:hypothetical protein
MNYTIVYDDSTNRHSAKRYGVSSTHEQLAAKITRIIDRGGIIVAVNRTAPQPEAGR